MKQISDPLYDGYTTIESDELAILDSSPVQRLRNVAQLGLSSKVYPGATHSRFVHSLGVLRLASQFADSLSLTEYERKVVRIAGLLHDVGHGPYSHAIEGAYPSLPDHESYSIQTVHQLDDDGILPVDADDIIDQILGNASIPIIAGDIDADRIDYLNRDAKFTGNSLGTVEHHTLIENAEVYNNSIVFHRNAIEALEGMLLSRKNMIGSVYQHPTARIAEKMLQEALQHYEHSNPKTVLHYDDYQLHTKLLQAHNNITRNLYEKITSRNLYKTSIEIRDSDISKQQKTELKNLPLTKLKQYICTKLETKPEEVLIDTQFNAQPNLNITIKTPNKVEPIQNFSSIDSMLDAPNDSMIFAVYTPNKYKDNVHTQTKQWLNTETAYTF